MISYCVWLPLSSPIIQFRNCCCKWPQRWTIKWHQNPTSVYFFWLHYWMKLAYLWKILAGFLHRLHISHILTWATTWQVFTNRPCQSGLPFQVVNQACQSRGALCLFPLLSVIHSCVRPFCEFSHKCKAFTLQMSKLFFSQPLFIHILHFYENWDFVLS